MNEPASKDFFGKDSYAIIILTLSSVVRFFYHLFIMNNVKSVNFWL